MPPFDKFKESGETHVVEPFKSCGHGEVPSVDCMNWHRVVPLKGTDTRILYQENPAVASTASLRARDKCVGSPGQQAQASGSGTT